MKLVVSPITFAKRLAYDVSEGGRWLYLGKDIAKRDDLSQVLGEKRLLALEDRLHLIAEQLRQPFLNFIAELGKAQRDQIDWWSSACSWKHCGASDLFLLICYERLVGQLEQEREEAHERLAVIVEDPWLFRQIQDTYSGSPNIEFRGTALLWPRCAKAFVRGCIARAVWCLRLVRHYVKQAWFWKSSARLDASRPRIALYSYPLKRSFGQSLGWNDIYLGDLDRLAANAGYAVFRFSPPELGQFERDLGMRSSYFRPMILYATPLSFLHAIGPSSTSWMMAPAFCSHTLPWLLRREWWTDWARASDFIHRFFFECMHRLLCVERPRLVVYPYENQPWEKMLILAARNYGIATLGYQHGGGMARFMLSYFWGDGEAEWAPVPDRIVTSSPYSHELLANGGTPRDRLIMGGAIRYQYLREGGTAVPLLIQNGTFRILVALPIESDLVRHLIYALKRAFPDGGRAEGIEFTIKPHPMCPVEQEALQWPATVVSGTFEEAIRECQAVLYVGSSTGFESLAMGRRVIRYRSELLLNMDRTDFLTKDDVEDCGDYDLRTKVLAVVHDRRLQRDYHATAHDLMRRVFPPMDVNIWIQTIRQLCR